MTFWSKIKLLHWCQWDGWLIHFFVCNLIIILLFLHHCLVLVETMIKGCWFVKIGWLLGKKQFALSVVIMHAMAMKINLRKRSFSSIKLTTELLNCISMFPQQTFHCCFTLLNYTSDNVVITIQTFFLDYVDLNTWETIGTITRSVLSHLAERSKASSSWGSGMLLASHVRFSYVNVLDLVLLFLIFFHKHLFPGRALRSCIVSL